jgi:hypothetical protein
MSLIRFGRGREYQFFRREDVRMRWDLPAAVQFLTRFRTDPAAMAGFRKQIARGNPTVDQRLSDEKVIQSMARLLVSGEVIIAMPQRDDRNALRIAEPEKAQTPKPAPKAQEEVEDEPTFDSDHDGVLQAAVLIAAARAAYPFCEECARHAAEETAVA